MPLLQESIHKLEVAGGTRYVKFGLAILGVLVVIGLYNVQSFKNMGSQEAMDSAQLAHNLAQGRGYKTHFVRPLSMYLFKRHNELAPNAVDKRLAELTQIKDLHPDISNPPVYPVVLAALMKVLPFQFAISEKPKLFWSSNGEFARYQPDFIISVFNQLLFFAAIVAVFFLAKRIFDARVAWTSAALLFGTEVFWRFSVSGLSTMFLLLIFFGLIWCLVLLEQESREMKRGIGVLLTLAVSSGVLLGIGSLTRYSFGWLILPVSIFLALFGGQRRWLLASITFVTFAVILTPWVVRNQFISGTPFGTAGYSLFATTPIFPEYKLERSLSPDFVFAGNIWFKILTQKLLGNARELIQNEIPKLGGNWVGAFFLVGLMVGFPNPAASRLRHFALLSLSLLLIVQALGHTQLSEESRQINSENILVLAGPLVLMYGVSFFYLLLDQVYLPIRELRYVLIGAFCVIACLPMLFALVPGGKSPLSYPPYHPPSIQKAAAFVSNNDLTMSDIPWAMAWYGQRQCIWLPPKIHPDFFDINDLQKPINALFLTRVTLDSRLISDWLAAGGESWPNVILETIPFSSQRDAEGNDTWPKRVELRLRQLNESTQASPLNLGMQNLKISTLPFHYWQKGWPEFIVLTTRENPITND